MSRRRPTYVDEYSTSEIIHELDRQSTQLESERGTPDPLIDIVRLASTRLRQYQIIDRQRLVEVMATVKRIPGG